MASFGIKHVVYCGLACHLMMVPAIDDVIRICFPDATCHLIILMLHGSCFACCVVVTTLVLYKLIIRS